MLFSSEDLLLYPALLWCGSREFFLTTFCSLQAVATVTYVNLRRIDTRRKV
jgi:hypothetical protein